MFPHANVNVVHVTDDDLPQEPHEHPNFWNIWRGVVRRFQPRTDFVFACEPYGFPLAEVLGARYIPVDRAREMVPVSAREVRANPLKYWEYLPVIVRPHFVKRVCLFGPESTGKSTLARRLAAHYDTAFVAEHARPLLDHKGGVCDSSDIPLIARGQVAAEDAMARQANRLLFCDTDPLLTSVWSEVLFSACPREVQELAMTRRYDLTLLTDIDAEWVDDGQRFLPHRRQEFMERCRAALDRSTRRYARISGSWDDRFAQACGAVDDLLAADHVPE
ncbi:MAG: AAA family ATPase [Planctomycetota bacterium]|nr:AAA family ATPase [Planctomycetota bacterium]